MNELVRVAQNSATPLDKRVVKLVRPADGAPQVVNVAPGMVIDMQGIAEDKIVLVHAGDRLIIMFADRSSIVLKGFYHGNGDILAGLDVDLGQGNAIHQRRRHGFDHAQRRSGRP